MKKNQIPVSDLPFHFHEFEEKKYGFIRYGELICPEVYYIATKFTGSKSHFTGEYIVATADSPAISSTARTFCTPLSVGNAILCEEECSDKGRHVIKYEAYKYLAEHSPPLPEGCSVEEEQIWGMETCPEYFGEFPIPTETPWGKTIRHDRISNGLYWLRTTEQGWVLAIAYPLCCGLSEMAEALAEFTDYDKRYGLDNTFGYHFYQYEASYIPLFELMEFEENGWKEKFNITTLKNAILNISPHYIWNFTEGKMNDYAALFVYKETSATLKAGIDFYHFQ